MSIGAIIAILIVLIVLAVVLVLVRKMVARRSAERRNLGPEYRRMADEVGTRKANAEYDKRRRRVDDLGIKPLSQERRALYATQWEAAQETFINSPAESVRAAQQLVKAVAADRGYEVADSDQLLTDLSVHHGTHVEGYRSALAVNPNATTEQLRQALLDYRGMFCSLTGIRDGDDMAATASTAGAGAVPAQRTDTAPEATDGTQPSGHRVR